MRENPVCGRVSLSAVKPAGRCLGWRDAFGVDGGLICEPAAGRPPATFRHASGVRVGRGMTAEKRRSDEGGVRPKSGKGPVCGGGAGERPVRAFSAPLRLCGRIFCWRQWGRVYIVDVSLSRKPGWLAWPEPSTRWIRPHREPRSRNVWRLFWPRADGKWHGYQPCPEVSSLRDALCVIDGDAHHCFFG